MSGNKRATCSNCDKLDAKDSPWCSVCERFKCAKCTKPIAKKKDQLSCPTCPKKFHPGCCLTYLTYLSANRCCVENFAPIDSATAVTVRQMDNVKSSNSVTNSSARSSLNLSNSELLPGKTDRDLLVDLNSMLANFVKKQTSVNEDQSTTLNVFIKKQNAVNIEHTNKLNEIQRLTNLLNDHEARLAQLENDNVQLKRHDERLIQLEEDNTELKRRNSILTQELSTLKPNLTPCDSSSSFATEFMISGIPLAVTLTKDDIVARVFDALDISHLLNDVLDIRSFDKKNSTQPSQSTTSGSTKKSFLVILKSQSVRNFILDKKRTKKNLSIEEVFGSKIQGSVYVNEFLPPALYNLFRLTKAQARSKGYKYVWVRSGTIFVRKADGQPPLMIHSEADIEKII